MSDSTTSKVFSGMFWKFSERITAQVVSFVISIILARILMPEEYGIVAMVTVFINIANVFVTSGFSTALIQKKDATDLDFSTIFWCTLLLSIVLYFVLFFSAPLIAVYYDAKDLIPIVRVFSLKIIISAYNSIQHAYVSRHMIFKKFFFSTLFGTVLSCCVGIGMAIGGFGVWALVAQYLTNSIVDTIVLGFTVSWYPKCEFSWKNAKPLLSFGWKVLVADLIGTIYNNLRQLLIGHYYTSVDLAYYNKGKQIPELISNNIDTTVNSVLFPAMSNAAEDAERVKYMTRMSMKITSYLIFPLMGGLIAVANPLIRLLLTEKWIDSVFFLQTICVARAINSVSNVNLQAMRALGRSDIVLKLEFIKKPVGVLMILIAIKVDIYWIAVSMPIYYFFATIVNIQPNKKLMGYTFLEQMIDILPATLFSTIMSVCVMQINHVGISDMVTLLIQFIVGIIIYVCLSIFTKNETFIFLFGFAKKRLQK